MTRLVKTKENINYLPNGFTEVEYLQSSGTEWIDTGVYPTQLTEVEYRCAVTGSVSNNDSHLFGSRLSASSEAFDLAYMNTQPNGIEKFRFIHGTTTTQETTTSVTESQLANPHTYYMSGTSFKVDGSEKMSFTTTSFTGTYSLWLFGVNSAGSLHNQVRAQRVYKCKIWDNNTLVRDFIPALNPAGRPCMYDLVSKKPYYNQGTGEFTYGRQIIPVEYLETTSQASTSTTKPWINTLVNYWADFEIGVKLRESASNVCLSCGGGSYRLERINATNPYWRFQGGGSGYNYDSTISITEYHVLKWKDGKISCDGEVLAERNHLLNSGTYTVLFANSTASGNTIYPNVVYFLKMWNPADGTLVRDYLPAIDENGVAFMFDRVTHTIFDNAGTGTFSYGSPIYTTKTRLIKDGYIRDGLPIGFKRVEYLEGTGTQYINTGLVSTNKSTIDITFSFSTMDSGATNNCAIFGGRSSSTYTTNTFTMFKLASGSPQYFRFDYNNQVNVGSASQLTWNTSSKYRFTYNGTTRTIENITTGEKVTASLSPATSYTTQPICLFAVNTMGTAGQFMKGRIYGYEYSDGTNTIKLVPAINSSNKPCMYDVVSGTPYYNLGSGEFNYGNILPSKEKTRLIPSWLDDYTFVNYIQSTGTQYINTGVTLTNNHSVEIDYQLTQASQSRAGLFGNLNMAGSNQGRFGSLLSPSNQQLEHGYGTGNDYWQQGSPNTNRHKLYQKKNEIYFDGTLIHTFTSATFTLNTTAPLGSFGYTNYTPAKAKYYNSKWWDGDTLIRNFIPAIRKSDSAVGMLDIVNRVFYTNQGTGVFSYGI